MLVHNLNNLDCDDQNDEPCDYIDDRQLRDEAILHLMVVARIMRCHVMRVLVILLNHLRFNLECLTYMVHWRSRHSSNSRVMASELRFDLVVEQSEILVRIMSSNVEDSYLRKNCWNKREWINLISTKYIKEVTHNFMWRCVSKSLKVLNV